MLSDNGSRMTCAWRTIACSRHKSASRSSEEILAIAQSTERIEDQLGQVGQADGTEILEAEAEEQRAWKWP